MQSLRQDLFPIRVHSRVLVDASVKHASEYLRIIVVTDGWARALLGTAEYYLSPGSFLIVPARIGCRLVPMSFTRLFTVQMPSGFLSLHLGWLPMSHPIIRGFLKESVQARQPSVVHLGDEIVRALRSKLALLAAIDGAFGSEFATLARVADVFDELALHVGQGRSKSKRTAIRTADHVDSRVASALRHMHENLAYPWTSKEIARSVALSESQLNRVFMRSLGVTPISLLWQIRVDRLAEALVVSNNSIGEISAEFGWSSLSAASRAFKRRYGKSPRQYAADIRGRGVIPKRMNKNVVVRPVPEGRPALGALVSGANADSVLERCSHSSGYFDGSCEPDSVMPPSLGNSMGILGIGPRE